jgi:transcriptional regulator with XRE-family HTH domain
LVLTQEQLAAQVGMPETTISRLENGKQGAKPRQTTIQKLAKPLGVSPAWLLWGEENGGPENERKPIPEKGKA